MTTMLETRRVAAMAALFLILAAACCGAVEVRLADGRTLEGTLRPIDDASFLLQTDDALLELAGSQIREVDGRRDLPRPEGRRLVRSSCYEVLRPDGSAEAWNTIRVENGGRGLQTRVEWGVAPTRWRRSARPWGNTLAHRFEPRPGSDVQSVVVELAVPVLPGESVELATSTIRRAAPSATATCGPAPTPATSPTTVSTAACCACRRGPRSSRSSPRSASTSTTAHRS
ncbi:MAG: hypothetical protein IPI34_05540 [bacterium]|nr:hypothetical protein [bacterium]